MCVLPSNESRTPDGAVDFTAFYHHRWADLRTAFRAATYLGIDPDDIVQETMMRVRQHHQRFASETELLMWCKRVGINLIRRQARTAYCRRERPYSNPVTAIADPKSDNAEERAVENLDLARTMAALRPQHAKVLILEAAGHTREEIASILEISPSAVGMLLMRARRAAQQSWAKGVAALLLFGFRVRKLSSTPPLPAQALVATVVTASVAVALALPHPAGTRWVPAPVDDSVADTTSVHLMRAQQPAPAAPTGKPAAPSSRLRVTKPSGPRTYAPKYVPRVPGACRAVRWCLCGDESAPGDHLYLKPQGESCSGVTDSTVPVCQYVVDNAIVGCHRRGEPNWTSLPPPGTSRNGVIG